jgi:hypothetical protein
MSPPRSVRRDGLSLAGAGQQPVVPDAVEAVRQDVDEEAADELARLERHGLVAARIFDAIVLRAQRHATIVSGDESAVRGGDAMGVALPMRLERRSCQTLARRRLSVYLIQIMHVEMQTMH